MRKQTQRQIELSTMKAVESFSGHAEIYRMQEIEHIISAAKTAETAGNMALAYSLYERANRLRKESA